MDQCFTTKARPGKPRSPRNKMLRRVGNPELSNSKKSCDLSSVCGHELMKKLSQRHSDGVCVKRCKQNRKGSGRKRVTRTGRKPALQKKRIADVTAFDTAQNKCFQQAILSLAAVGHAHVHDVLQRMFRSTMANDGPTGSGSGKTGLANLYATENALRFIGTYILVFESNK